MTKHVRVFLTLSRGDALAEAVGRADYRYSQYVNRLHGRSGHLWRNRSFSCALDDAHYLAAMRYVERNPVRARLHRGRWGYAWSSAAYPTGASAPAIALDDTCWRDPAAGLNWRAFLLENDASETAAFRLYTSRGRPLATDTFLSKLEAELGRRLCLLPVGRPRSNSRGRRCEKG